MDILQNNEMIVEETEYIESSKPEDPEISEPDFIGELKTDETKTGEQIIREALLWLPRDPSSKENTRINEERPLDNDNHESENIIIANSSSHVVSHEGKDENKQQNREEGENEGDDTDDLFGGLIKEFNDLELAKPANQPGNIKHMMKDAEKNPLDGVLDMPENDHENEKVKVKDEEDVMGSSEESDDEEEEEGEKEEEHGGLYAFLDPKQEKELEDDESKFHKIQNENLFSEKV